MPQADRVRMFNPNLPGQPEIDVFEQAVAHHRHSGWLLTSERPAPDPAPPSPAAPAAVKPDPKPATTSRPKPEGTEH